MRCKRPPPPSPPAPSHLILALLAVIFFTQGLQPGRYLLRQKRCFASLTQFRNLSVVANR